MNAETANDGGLKMIEIKKSPYTIFGKTKIIPVVVYQNNKIIESDDWDETMWVERGEDYYGLMSMGNKKVRVVSRDEWLRSKEVDNV